MLSVEKCKQILDNETLSDKDAESILEQLYQIATVLVESYLERPSGAKSEREKAFE